MRMKAGLSVRLTQVQMEGSSQSSLMFYSIETKFLALPSPPSLQQSGFWKGLYSSPLPNKWGCLVWVSRKDLGLLGGAVWQGWSPPVCAGVTGYPMPCPVAFLPLMPKKSQKGLNLRLFLEGFGDSFWPPCAAGLCYKVISVLASSPAPHTHADTCCTSNGRSQNASLQKAPKIHFSFIIIFPQAKQLMTGLGENIHLCFQVISCRFARLNPFKNPESHPFSP